MTWAKQRVPVAQQNGDISAKKKRKRILSENEWGNRNTDIYLK